jgi:hypothetical protein
MGRSGRVEVCEAAKDKATAAVQVFLCPARRAAHPLRIAVWVRVDRADLRLDVRAFVAVRERKALRLADSIPADAAGIRPSLAASRTRASSSATAP